MRQLLVVDLSSQWGTESYVDSLSHVSRYILSGQDVETVILCSGASEIGHSIMAAVDVDPIQDRRSLGAIGQITLMSAWQSALAPEKKVSQVLLRCDDVVGPSGLMDDAMTTLEYLLKMGTTPIVSENEATSEEGWNIQDIATALSCLIGANDLCTYSSQGTFRDLTATIGR